MVPVSPFLFIFFSWHLLVFDLFCPQQRWQMAENSALALLMVGKASGPHICVPHSCDSTLWVKQSQFSHVQFHICHLFCHGAHGVFCFFLIVLACFHLPPLLQSRTFCAKSLTLSRFIDSRLLQLRVPRLDLLTGRLS